MKTDFLDHLLDAARQSPPGDLDGTPSRAFLHRMTARLSEDAARSVSALLVDFTKAFHLALATAVCLTLCVAALERWQSARIMATPLEDALLRPILMP